MNKLGLLFIVVTDVIGWALVYWGWRYNALPALVALSSCAVLFGSLLRLMSVMDAPFYDRRAAHSYANMACCASCIGAVAAFFL